jgi:hypothetical protein
MLARMGMMNGNKTDAAVMSKMDAAWDAMRMDVPNA